MPHTRTASKAAPLRSAAEGSTEAIEDYAKAIFGLEQRAPGPVSTSALADRLDVAPSTVTAMAKRLDDLGLVTYTPYRGMKLTENGRLVALEVVRHHRLIEAFLAATLDMPWDRVHDEAEVLEHYISEDLERLIAAKLGDPVRDPHGDPIPSADLVLASDRSVRLSELEPGATAIFERVSDSDSAMLRFLDQRGIHPGCELRVRAVDPFEGPLYVEAGEAEHVLGRPLAAAMWVMAREDER